MGARWSGLGQARSGGSGRWCSLSRDQLSLLDWRRRRTKAQAGWRWRALNCRGVVEGPSVTFLSLAALMAIRQRNPLAGLGCSSV